ncbi:B3 domain-containing protein [Sesamum alatum]|uniref:B3 domain-containing protein n=1 Tax=Sesamum alatum TaxID=300844 RepID=A0AAE1XJZ9_9LAMI|nr:B3 domain-containing protein [Sesamum alatum]
MSKAKSLVPIPHTPLNNCDFCEPSFYKIVLPDTNIAGVKIPLEFLKHMEEEESGGVATLTVSSGQKWQVKVCKRDNGVVFKDGWKRFCRENSVRVTDFLQFTYHGNLQFSVDIFDKSGLRTN